jgi:hypothetical protein
MDRSNLERLGAETGQNRSLVSSEFFLHII